MNFDMYTMERRLEMTLPVQTNLNTSIGSTRLVTFTEHTVNTYIFPLLLPNRGKIHLSTVLLAHVCFIFFD
jgi:hypothetical protein